MLRDKLDASLVAVARDAVEKSAALAIAVAGGELGNDGEGRQTSEIFDVVGTLDGVVEIFAKYGESNASHEANKKSEHEIAGFGGAGRIGRNHGGIDDANVGRLETFLDADFLAWSSSRRRAPCWLRLRA